MKEGESQMDSAVSGLEPFVDALYEQGNPDRACSEDDDLQTPLYDSLRSNGDRYVEQTLIAEGGMKEIYLAFDRMTSRQVALAKPSRKLGIDHYDSFLREAHLTARLEHPCIINLFGMGVDESERPFFTMEFKRGRSLRRILADLREGTEPEKWTINRRLGILLKVCEGLAYAHSRRVLHLDLKPDNIQVGSFGEVQICDWGLGVVMQSEGDRLSEVLLDPDLYGSMQREIKGTALYMAPEMFNPRVLKTPQMDIYALGGVMEELVNVSPPGSPKSRNSEPALEAIVRKAQSKDPAMRYHDVEEMRRDIERHVEGYSTSVEKKTMRRELALFYGRNRLASNIALGAALLLLLVAGLFVGRLKISRDEANQARRIAEEAMSSAVASKAEEELARIRAVEALEDLQTEKELSLEHLRREARTAWLDSHHLVGLFLQKEVSLADLVDAKIAGIETVTAENPPPDHYVWNQKFWMYFLAQQFDRAIEIQESGNYVDPDLVPLARKFAERSRPQGCLSDADFMELLQELNSPELKRRTGLGERMLEYDLRNPRSPETRAASVIALLSLANPEWNSAAFHYDPSTQDLKIGGTHLIRLAQGGANMNPFRCLLRFLDPEKLDISGTGIQDLSAIKNLRLLELDIRDTPVKSLKPLENMRSLRKVIVTSEQLTPQLLEGLPPSVEVVEK